ncbi:MAG: type III-A CRISPR-associated protein Csm2 [Deferribacteraceae bacterium]|jgi:CRISPR-associated protein Csm2|nr:type III-A CRISPR-associated protein Csm2 [Deferribacteraceae bacterium]
MANIVLTKTNYGDEAEKVIKELKDKASNKKDDIISTSQMRNLYTVVNQLYNDVILSTGEQLSEEYQSRFSYLRIRMAYEAGRTKSVKKFITVAELFKQHEVVKGSREKFILFCRYFEALVAYHKYYADDELTSRRK